MTPRPPTAWLALLCCCCMAACHPATPSTPTPTPPPASSPGVPAIFDAIGETGETGDRGDGATDGATGDADDAGPPNTPAASDGSPCERSCAELHACVIEQGERGPAAASSIELGCLEACVPSPTPGSLFGCELPSASAETAPCGFFLACVRDAWPQAGAGPVKDPGVAQRGPGCEQACWAFARCRGADQDQGDRDAIGLCIRQCSETLDDEQERLAGECTDLPDCREIKRCILAIPGA